MRIIRTYNWSRRDFSYDAQCESCHNIDKNTSGYDDSNYYNNVVPKQKCTKCGKCSNDLPKDPEVLETKTVPRYSEHLIM